MLPIVKTSIPLFPLVAPTAPSAAPLSGSSEVEAGASAAGAGAYASSLLLLRSLCERLERCNDEDETIAAHFESLIRPDVLSVL